MEFMRSLPTIECPNCRTKQEYNRNGKDYWGQSMAKCRKCGHLWAAELPKEPRQKTLSDYTIEELERELARRKWRQRLDN